MKINNLISDLVQKSTGDVIKLFNEINIKIDRIETKQDELIARIGQLNQIIGVDNDDSINTQKTNPNEKRD